MKNPELIFMGMVLLFLMTTVKTDAQNQQESPNFSVNADIVSNYVWRGTRFGQGPHIQPGVKFVTGGLTFGVWGSFDFNGYSETDPYLSYSFPFGLSLGVTDYYFPGLQVFETSVAEGSHALEINAGYTTGGLSLSANYIVNEAGGAASFGSDLYFQAGYAFKTFNLFAGVGDGWHTSDGEFNLCNLGIGTTKKIEMTEKFSLPLFGQVILNPEREQLYLVVGFSF